MPVPRVLVLFNEPTLPADHPDAEAEHDILALADVVVRVLQLANLTVGRLGVVDSADAVVNGVRAFQPDVVFNLYEGTAGWGNAEAYVAGVLDLLRVPYTGSSPQALLLARSKPHSKQLLAGAGIPTAPYFLVNSEPCPTNPIGWPVIVKPGREDASIGIDQKSVCTSQAELASRVGYVQQTFGPGVVVEKLIVGRELHAAVIETPNGLTTLPLTEILFPKPADGKAIWPIVTFDAKWREGSRDYLATPYKNPADVTPELEREVGKVAVRAFELMGCRDYARVDFRVDQSDRPFVLEVNPNPCIAPGAGVAESLASSRIPYPDFILGLVRSALRRGARPDLANEVGAVEPLSRLPHSVMTQSRSTTPAEIHPSGWDVRTESNNNSGVTRIQVSTTTGIIGRVAVRAFDKPNHVFELIDFQISEREPWEGVAFLRTVERHLADIGARILVTSISSGPNDSSIRILLASEYSAAGEISDYFKSGYSRLTFMKVLSPPGPQKDRPSA